MKGHDIFTGANITQNGHFLSNASPRFRAKLPSVGMHFLSYNVRNILTRIWRLFVAKNTDLRIGHTSTLTIHFASLQFKKRTCMLVVVAVGWVGRGCEVDKIDRYIDPYFMIYINNTIKSTPSLLYLISNDGSVLIFTDMALYREISTFEYLSLKKQNICFIVLLK